MTTTIRVLTDLVVKQCPRWREETIQLPPSPAQGIWGDILQALLAARMWRPDDVIVTASVRRAALYGCLKRVLPGRTPRIMVLETRFDDPMPTLTWKLKLRLQRFAFLAVDDICVSASREIADYSERLRQPTNRFHFVPWHTNVVAPHRTLDNDGYVFAAGRTGRDWQVLATAADAVPARIIAVMSSADLARVTFPSNVETRTDIPYDEYRQLLERARVVVVPLQVHSYSSGQVALLEAMSLGKPVVCTRVVGTEDYLLHGQNGLFVRPSDSDALASAIKQILENPELEHILGESALQTVLRDHTFDHYIARVLALARRRRPAGT